MADVVPMTQPSREVLENPDLLFLIFSFQANHSLVDYIRVCKAWFDPAADLIWKDVPGLSPVIALLVPLEHNWTQPIEIEDWSRFDLYAKRIQFLAVSSSSPRMKQHRSNDSSPIIWPSLGEVPSRSTEASLWSQRSFLLRKMARMRPKLDDIFPRLHTLNLDLNEVDFFYTLSILLQPTLRTLNLNFLLDYTKSDYEEAFQLIVDRAPFLERLAINFGMRINGMEDRLHFIWKHLPNLSEVSFPSSLMSSKFMSVLTDFPKLRGVHMLELRRDSPPLSPGPHPVHTLDLPESVFIPNFDVDNFPSLTSLSIKLDIGKSAEFFGKLVSPKHLTSLQLTSDPPLGGVTFSSCLIVLADNCLALERLVVFSHYSSHSMPSIPPENRSITYHDLQNLLLFHKLVDFRLDILDYRMSVRLSDDDTEKLAAKWPSLKHFCLKYVVPFGDPGLNLASLISFAKHCPKLETLTLTLDTDLEIPTIQSIPVVFSTLYELTIGWSSTEDPFRLAIFLSGLLPPFCTINHPNMPRARSRVSPSRGTYGRGSLWETMSEYLQLINLYRTQNRTQEWAAITSKQLALEAENEQLKVRVKELEERLKS